jgi:hypothetical protein
VTATPGQVSEDGANDEHADCLAALVPVGIALSILAEYPLTSHDAAAWVMFAVCGNTYEQIATVAAERSWPELGSRRWSVDGVTRAIKRARSAFLQIVDLRSDGQVAIRSGHTQTARARRAKQR